MIKGNTVADNTHNLRLEFDTRDYQTLKLAAALTGHANLRSWCRATLLDQARKIIKDANLKAQKGEGDDLCSPSF